MIVEGSFLVQTSNSCSGSSWLLLACFFQGIG
jgi:hypothetical protein